ncbi:hypothetical protein BGZ47_011110 [Haplosporangium gracile]|nr:hypothetical protein BGZ47_011110 [Haplosporangium gracile]
MNDGKRALSQLERKTKFGRTSSSTSNIPTALQSVHHDTLVVPGSISGMFNGSFSLGSHLRPSIAHTFSPYHEDIPMVEHALQDLRKQRMDEYKQVVYIAPTAKSNLQASDDSLFSLMENVKEFLASNGQVMLILGDSGAGKSTFNRYMETGDRIPLFINLPGLERPEKELPGQWDTKLLITCRTQYLGSDYRNRFVPKASSQYYRSADDLFQEVVIAPFSKDQIGNYVERYVPLEPRTWVKEDYMDKLTTIRNLMDLVKNPFLLTLCLEALPSVVEGKADLSRLWVTRTHLYDNFVEHWMAVNKRRLQEQKLSGDELKALEELLDDGFEKAEIKFQQDLATAIFREQEGRPVVDYTHRRDKDSWKVAFFSSEPETTLLRTASLLSRVANQFRFVHRSVLEYFYSYLVAEPSIVQFLSERVHSNPEFEQHLHDLLERSKTDDQACRAAANAITILVRAGVRFNGADLRGIRIPGADLTAGQFDTAQLQDADLTGVNFTKGWIRQADLSGAQMQGIEFGELPYLEENWWLSCAYSPDGKTLAVILGKTFVSLYNTDTWTKVEYANGRLASRACFGRSLSNIHIVFGDGNHNVLLRNIETELNDLVLEGHKEQVTAVAFSPCGKQLASASGDMTVRVWDISTEVVVCVFADHFSKVTCISYSPDGLHIASGACDGTIRIFDAQSGLLEMSLDSAFGSITSVAHSPDGLWIVSGDDDSELQLWNVATGTLGHNWTGHTGCITSVDYSSSGQWIISSSEDSAIKLWDAQTKRLVSVFSGHMGAVNNAVFSPDGLHVASGGRDGIVRLWQSPLTAAELDIHGSSGPISSIFYPSNGQQLLCANDSGCVNVLAFSPDGKTIATDSHDGTVRLWDSQSGSTGRVLVGHDFEVNALAFSPDGHHIVSGNDDPDGPIRIWTVSSGESRVLTDDNIYVNRVAYSSDGRKIASMHFGDSDLKIWDEQSGECLFTLAHGENGEDSEKYFALSDYGQWIAIALEKFLWIWNLSVKETTERWQRVVVIVDFLNDIRAVVWRPHCLDLAIGCEDGSVRVFTLQNTSSEWSARLVWSTASPAFIASDAMISNVVGLSSTNRRLLLQRRAKDKSFTADEEEKETQAIEGIK